jgi:hypothetical protein
MELEDIARAATSGDAICTKQHVEEVANPESDLDYDPGEFFDVPECDISHPEPETAP